MLCRTAATKFAMAQNNWLKLLPNTSSLRTTLYFALTTARTAAAGILPLARKKGIINSILIIVKEFL